MGSFLSRLSRSKSSSKIESTKEKAIESKSATPTSTTDSKPASPTSMPDSKPATSGSPTTFASDLESAVKSTRSVFSSDVPPHPLPKCFFSLKPDNDGCGFQFDFQWASNDGAVIHVTVVDVEKYPKDHEWKVELMNEDGATSFVTETLAKQGEWKGLRIRQMLAKMDAGFWGKRT